MSDEEERARALALLEATHEFPVEYSVSVIVETAVAAVEDLRRAAEEGLDRPLPDEAMKIVASRTGRYSSHRLRVPCRNAEEVLALYARLRQVNGVITIL